MKKRKVDSAAGLLHLQIDSLDDLWTLRNLIQAGDLVTGSTYRTAEAQDDKLRSEKREKKRMRIGVRVEQVEFHDFADQLRVLGTIEAGPQDHGRHHTLVLTDEPGTDVVIQKRGPLARWHLDTMREAIDAARQPQVILLAIDDDEAQFALLKAYGIQMLGSLPAGGQGKAFGDPAAAKQLFFAETLKTLKTLRTHHEIPLIVVGPGWWREEFLDHARDKEPDVVDGALTEGTGQGGRTGIHEAVRRGLVDRVSREHKVLEESAKVEEVFARIGRGGELVAYGPEQVSLAVQAGAAEELLVTDEVVRGGKHTRVLEAAGKVRCHVHVVATSHEAGARLQQIGGLAALLRYAVS